jgi:hypothetical protein
MNVEIQTTKTLSRNQRRKQNQKMRYAALANQGQGSSQITISGPAQVANSSQNQQKRKRNRKRRGANTMRSGSAMNYYLASLQDPENYPGAKVPDLCTFPTGTFQLTRDFTLTTGSATSDSVGIVLVPNIGEATNAYGPMWTAVNSAIGGNCTFTQTNWTDKAAIQGAYQYVRPVSAMIIAEFVGNSATDGGQIVGGLLERQTLSNGYNNLVISYNTAVTSAFSKALPVRNGLRVVWKPMDNHDLEFRPAIESAAADVDYPPALFIMTGGMGVSTPLRVRCVVNFEGVPKSDTSTLVTVSPSPINLSQLTEAFSWASQAYNNVSAFVDSVGPYVYPALRQGIRYGLTGGSALLANRMNQLALRR